ncbi:MAG: hypothetical protein MUE73_21780 [Planctomycetes bacterium]|jgi:hypothetical protein|nr:hypothetical protein [Planctomycetota bacterium]
MRVFALLLAAVATGPAIAGETRVARAMEDLSSPFADRREQAVALLVAEAAAAAPALCAAYGESDFERKVLILEVFARGAPREGIALVTGDAGPRDRGVVLAQRRLVSALFLAVRDAVAERLPLLTEAGDWRTEEALRALPSRTPSPRLALRSALESGDPRRSAAAVEVAGAVADVDHLRHALVDLRAGGDERVAEAARELERHLLRHETERALRAVLEAGGRSGSYEGMYALVGELSLVEPGVVRATLLSVVTGRSPGEGGVPGPRDGAGLLETGLLDRLEMRERAAACLGEVGGPEAAGELGEYYAEMKGEHEPDRYDDMRWPVALALGALGVREPLLGLIRDYSATIGLYGEDGGALHSYMTGWIHEELATAYTRLGDLVRAEVHLRASLRDRERPAVRMYNYACLLSRLGKVEESLAALREAVEGGYALDPGSVRWMQRDGDLMAVRATEGFARLMDEIRAGLHSLPR